MIKNIRKHLPAVAFGIYAAAMVYLLFIRGRTPDAMGLSRHIEDHMNLTPFYTIEQQLSFFHLTGNERWRLIRFAVINLGGNIATFVPLGLFLPLLFDKLRRLWRTMLVSLGIILVIETTQLLTLRGSFDIDDFILNMAGVLIGYGLYHLFAYLMTKTAANQPQGEN